MIAMIDMDMGNLQSVREALQRIGASVKVTDRPEDVEQADAVILPGVGAFGDGMTSLHVKRLVEPLRLHAFEKKRPILGICIGMQLMADEGEEHGLHKGLGMIRGRVVRLNPTEEGCRVPNMGWCDVKFKNSESKLFGGFQQSEAFYFAHSYHLQCSDSEDVAATIDYGSPLTAAIEHDNIFGVQFHPEKSQDAGLNVLASFIKYVS
jgi:imidazole glycerol-phosphate synthase subunit HisH